MTIMAITWVLLLALGFPIAYALELPPSRATSNNGAQ